MREQGHCKTGIAALLHQTRAHECSGPLRRTTEAQLSPSQELGRGGVCFEDSTLSQLSGRQAIYCNNWVAPAVKLAPVSAPGPAGERQEHLDAIVSFAGVGQKRRLFRGLNILAITWAVGDLPEECRFLPNTRLVFLKKENDPTSKQFDAADVPEDIVLYD